MKIKYLHDHDGFACYRISSRHGVNQIQLVDIGGKDFAIAYMPYTGHWYLCDPETGEGCGTLTKVFADALLKAHAVNPMNKVHGKICV